MERYQSWVCPIAKIISPTILDVREIFALPCHLSLCGQPSGTGKSFIINFQYLTHPAVCHWGAIPCSFLVSLLQSHLRLLTRHIGCWENQSHTFQWLKLPRCRAVTWPISLPRALTTQLQLLYVLFLLHTLVLLAVIQIRLHNGAGSKHFLFHEEKIEDKERDGGASLPFSVCPLPCLWFLHSLHLSASASIDRKTEKEIESWSSQGKKVWWDHMGHCF